MELNHDVVHPTVLEKLQFCSRRVRPKC